MSDYVIARADMRKKMERVLRRGGDLYTFDDIMQAIEEHRMQSFVNGNTWIITQIHAFPRRKVLEIAFVVGYIEEAVKALPRIYGFAKAVGATRVTGFGRDGWWEFAQPGWKKLGAMYSKEL
jgi:hypothetical protein